MRRGLAVLAGTALVAAGVVAVSMRMVEDSPGDWHVDPVSASRTGEPNDYLVAPEGATAAAPDRLATVRPLPPRELIARFDEIALQAPRTRRIAGSPDDLHATYVQRSAVFGFPDYITAKAVEADGGAALIVWSRARFGYGDMGVNAGRVEDWLAQVGAAG